jgi:phosphatidylglycerophosphatase A
VDARESRLGVLLLSAFGLGLSPVLPGTVGSLGTAALLWIVSASGVAAFVSGIVLLVIGACWATLRFAGAVTGPEGRGDPGWVVSDEVAGQALACLGALPWLDDWRLLGVSFVLFRVFDMLKPPPVSTLEKLHGAKGILYDDLAAGVLAAVGTLVVGFMGWLPG